MASESVIFTALPNGVDETVALFGPVTPKLS